jgi:hypothetical protein
MANHGLKPVVAIINRSVNAGDRINTGFAPYEADLASTLLLDIHIISSPTTGVSSKWVLLASWNGSLNNWMLHITKQSNTEQRVRWAAGSVSPLANIDATPGRYRYAITHETNSNNVTIKYKKDAGTVYTITKTAAFTPANNILYLGGSENNVDSLPQSVINKFEAYNVVLSDANIGKLFE